MAGGLNSVEAYTLEMPRLMIAVRLQNNFMIATVRIKTRGKECTWSYPEVKCKGQLTMSGVQL